MQFLAQGLARSICSGHVIDAAAAVALIMASVEGRCFFWEVFSCSEKTPLSQSSVERIIQASKQYEDGLHIGLEHQQELGIESIPVHRKCIDKYCHKKSVQKAVRERADSSRSLGEDLTSKPKRARRSEQPTFSFLQHCLFCGKWCDTEKDPKHPGRWRPAFVCREGEKFGSRGLKEAIYDTCEKRNDVQSEQVTVRMAGVLSDLHAADVRYHVDCRSSFMCTRSIQAAVRQSCITDRLVDAAFDSVITYLASNKATAHSSVNLYTKYVEEGGQALSRRQLVTSIIETFGGDIIALSSPGIATILAFKATAAKMFHMIPDDTDDMCDVIEKVSKKIKTEINNIEVDKKNYHGHLDRDICSYFQSNTLNDILSRISGKLNESLPSLLIGNIITSVVKSLATPLQIALAILLRDSKEQVKTFHDFGVTCSYDELLRFKKSVAFNANATMDTIGLKKSENGLIQGVGDNFDQQISSQNGKVQTHSMALLMTHSDDKRDENEKELTPRISKSEMTQQIPYVIEVGRYTGPKKPIPSEGAMTVKVQSLSTLAQMAIVLNRVKDRDFEFLKSVNAGHGCPEYNGFNTKKAREEGLSLQQKTRAIYLPLIDMPPAEYDTVLTSMLQVKRLSEAAGQPFTVLTFDQQLYRYAVEIQWARPDVFPQSTFLIRLGGMHMLMSFVGAVGNLMTETGLSDVMSSAFSGVHKMLQGKKFPMCMRALRMVIEVILTPIIGDAEVKCPDTFMASLEARALKSETCKLWLDCLIKPVLLMMAYVRAEREGEWPLHVHCVRAMMPYFFAAGHQNYARLGLVYLRAIENLPEDILRYFLKGKHVMRHMKGLWNGIWSDMFIESTFMRYGHGRAGIVGITLKPETLKTWALSRHTCSQLVEDLAALRGESDECRFQISHKEEANGRRESDKNDREALKNKLDLCIHPLKPEVHPPKLVNVANGTLAVAEVNVCQAISIGYNQLVEFEKSLPTGFWKPIERRIKTMAVTKKGIPIGSKVVYDTQLIFSRVIGLQASSREVDFKDVLSYELAPIPTALFDDSGNTNIVIVYRICINFYFVIGEMRICKSKADLKKSTRVEVSMRNADRMNCTILDGCAILWCIAWPASSPTNQALVADYVKSVKEYLQPRLSLGDVYLVFDRYIEFSTKCSARKARGTSGYRVYQLSINAPLPPQKQVLTVSENKKQLIRIIVETLVSDAVVPGGYKSRLVITGQEYTPIEISPNGVVIRREDLKTTHEEADTIIVAQAIYAAKEERKNVVVVADDTDVYILLLYYYHAESLTIPMKLQSTQTGRAFIDISATVQKLKNMIPELLPAHALSGCDTVPMCHGIGKGKMLKAVQTGKCSLSLLGNVHADMQDITKQAAAFMCRCYNVPNAATMTEARIKVWLSKTGRKSASKVPKLCSLPPTMEVFQENVKRAHFQCVIWKSALQEPPHLDPTQYGWFRDEETKSLRPIMLPPTKLPAPDYVLKLVCCSCASETPCNTSRCGCVSANLTCTAFCHCEGSSTCKNEQTKAVEESESDTET